MSYNRFMPKENILGIVKRRLWSSGYAVSERSRVADGFDLLVDNKHRVMVVAHRKGVDCFEGGDANPPFDNIASVSFDAAERPVVVYTTAQGPTPSPRVAFGLPIKSKDHGNKKTRKEKGEEGRPQKFAVGGHI